MICNIEKRSIFDTAIFLLLLQFCAYPQPSTNFLRTFFSNAGNLPWEVEIDSMISLLKDIGVESCCVSGINNHNTVGPSVTCTTDTDGRIGLGYRWDKDYVPYLDFFLFHSSNCDSCLQLLNSLKQFDYFEYKEREPLEVKKLYRDFLLSDSTIARIEIWNECCPGNRIKIYRTIRLVPAIKFDTTDKKNYHRMKKNEAEEKAATKK